MTGIRRVSQLGTAGESTYVDGSIQAVDIADGTITQAKLSADIPLGGMRNVIINGAMQVAQRGTSTASITADGYNTADRWKTDATTLGTWTQSVENDAPTGSEFRKSLKMLCTTADASPAAGDRIAIVQSFEGQNVQSIKKGTSSASQLLLTFWVKSNLTGTYIVELFDVDNTRQVSLSYTVLVSATWEKKTIVLPADTTGAFDNDANGSLDIRFWLGVGSTYSSGTLNTSWASNTSANRAVGQTNLAAATSNYWQVTGVQLEVGAVATPFEFEDIGVTLAKCQRYFEKSYVQGVTVGTNNNNGLVVGQSSTAGDSYWYFTIEYKVTKRTKDVTATFYNSTGATSLWSWGRSGSSGNNTPSIQYQSDNWLQIYIYGGVAWVAMQAVGHYAVSAEL